MQRFNRAEQFSDVSITFDDNQVSMVKVYVVYKKTPIVMLFVMLLYDLQCE